ncbi:MAG: AAA family ATPase [Deltaproteobacteria bacterium]|nr:AAA family ATPase [Deltaproteobacteria bacterium]
MKIAGWHIEGFGIFSDWRVDDVPGGLSLFYGPNEAGKSTLLGFLRFALFGFRGGNARESRFPPLAGGRHGGRVWLIGEDTLSAFGGGEDTLSIEAEGFDRGEDTHAAFGGGEDGLASSPRGAREVVVERIAAPARKLSVTLSAAPSSAAPSDDPPGEAPRTLAASDLERLLGYADRALFQNVFAFSLAELQSLASLGEEGVQDHIFSAGITGAGRSARDALRRIDADAAALYKVSRKGKFRVRELAEAVATRDAELAGRRQAAEAYPDLAAAERAMAVQLDELHAATEAQRETRRQAEKLGVLWREVWSPIEEARRQLAELSPVTALPDDAGLELERCRAAVEGARAALESVEDDQRACRRQLESLAPSSSLEAVVVEIETLHRQLSLYETQLKERPLLREGLAGAESAVTDALANLGADWDEARLQDFDVSLENVDQAIQWSERLAASAADRADLDRRRTDFEERRGRLQGRVADILERRDAIRAPEARALDERAAALRGLRGRLADCETARARVEASCEAIELAEAGARTGFVAPWAAPVAAGLAALCAAPALTAALRTHLATAPGAGRDAAGSWWLESGATLKGLLPSALTSALPSTLPFAPPAEALVPAALAISALMAGFALLLLQLRRQESRRRRDEGEALERASTGARARLGEHLRELARAAASLGLSRELRGEELDGAEAQLEEDRRCRQEWERLQLLAEEARRELDECQRELTLLEPCLEAALRRQDEREEGWCQWKRGAGAPEGLAAATLPRFFEQLQLACASVEARRRAAHELGRREAETRAWEERARRALARAGRDEVGREGVAASQDDIRTPATGQDGEGVLPGQDDEGATRGQDEDVRAARLLEAFADLRRRCRHDGQLRERRQPLEERAVELGDRRTAAAKRLLHAQAERDSLFEAAGVKDEEGFRHSLDLSARRGSLAEQIRAGEGELDRRVGRGGEADACREELVRGRVGEWEREANRARESASRTAIERDELLRRHQDLRGQLSELEASSAVMELEQERAELLAELEEAVAQWRRLRVARGLIEATLTRFERERQPAVLNQASRYFATVTGGRYRRILQSANSEAFEVVDAGDRRKAPAELSRGTAEQLYVCIRLGLIAEFARRQKRLPVVMDDVLVNFDDARARAMLGVLREFAADTRSQLLFFSCSERTRELFAEAAPEAPRRALPI